jgi:hypothetical protein
MEHGVLTNQIIGQLIEMEKYKFIDGKLIAEIVKDALSLLAVK